VKYAWHNLDDADSRGRKTEILRTIASGFLEEGGRKSKTSWNEKRRKVRRGSKTERTGNGRLIRGKSQTWSTFYEITSSPKKKKEGERKKKREGGYTSGMSCGGRHSHNPESMCKEERGN